LDHRTALRKSEVPSCFLSFVKFLQIFACRASGPLTLFHFSIIIQKNNQIRYLAGLKGESKLYLSRLKDKWQEALKAVLPIIAIVLVLCLSVAPLPSSILLSFLFGGLLLLAGMMLFTLGAELSMEQMGERVGAELTRTKNLPLILVLGFFMGFLITMSEPDLQVLANQVQSIPSAVLIASVAGGVGLFLVIALLRMLFGIQLRTMLLVFYGLVLLLAAFVPKRFLAVAFDAGGVTTGPMTVPFIMAFGIGISSIRSDNRAAEDSFGLIALCSVGPILAVQLLSLIYHPEDASYSQTMIPQIDHSVQLGRVFLSEVPTYLKEVSLALLPIAVFFAAFQVFRLRMNRKPLIRILVGLVYTYVGLVLFLTGVNVGFLPAGSYLGGVLTEPKLRFLMIPLGMLMGYFIVKAEPAVYVLMRQVEELTSGAISGHSLQVSLSVSVSLSVGLAMLRVLTGISILWMLIPGYLIALILSFLVPRMFTAIAFDSGGVASGPMTATFLLPFAMGACQAAGGDVVTDAFGVVAMVAMTPLLTLQLLGLRYRLHFLEKEPAVATAQPEYELTAIIEL